MGTGTNGNGNEWERERMGTVTNGNGNEWERERMGTGTNATWYRFNHYVKYVLSKYITALSTFHVIILVRNKRRYTSNAVGKLYYS
jgi:hypothetical protein